MPEITKIRRHLDNDPCTENEAECVGQITNAGGICLTVRHLISAPLQIADIGAEGLRRASEINGPL